MLIAHSFQASACNNPACGAVHFELLDAQGMVFADMAIGPDALPDLIKMLQDHLYARAALKDGGEP